MAKKNEEKVELPRWNFMYIGVKSEKYKGKTVHLWANISEIENDGSKLVDDVKMMSFPGKNIVKGIFRPGVIFSFSHEVESEGTFYLDGEYVGRWKNLEQAKFLEVQNRVRLDAFAAESEKSKELSRTLSAEALEPFREAYWKSSHPTHRQQLFAYIYRCVTQRSSLIK